MVVNENWQPNGVQSPIASACIEIFQKQKETEFLRAAIVI